MSRTAACAILLGLAIGNVAWAMTDWRLTDMWVYWRAAEQWQAVGNPYALLESTDATSVYRYAPWLAAVFVPLTWLDPLWVAVGFATLTTTASVLAVVPMYRSVRGLEGLAASAFFASILFGFRGNIHPVLIAAIVWAAPTRAGPAAIALAASLKAVPIVFLLLYVARRQWSRLIIGLVLFAVLVAPMLLFERPSMTVEPGASNSLWMMSPIAWGATAVLGLSVATVLAARGSGWTGLATGAAACLALPRAFVYDITFLLPGAFPLNRQVPRGRSTIRSPSP